MGLGDLGWKFELPLEHCSKLRASSQHLPYRQSLAGCAQEFGNRPCMPCDPEVSTRERTGQGLEKALRHSAIVELSRQGLEVLDGQLETNMPDIPDLHFNEGVPALPPTPSSPSGGGGSKPALTTLNSHAARIDKLKLHGCFR